MASREPLLDTDWLLGSPDRPGLWWRRFLYQTGVALIIVMIGVGLWPTLSRAWVQSQLAQQYQLGNTIDSRNAAMVALAEMLPESLPVVMAGLSNQVPEEAHLAFEALDYYVGQLTTLSVEPRRGAFAELILALEEIKPTLNAEAATLAMALAARVTAVQQSDRHPGSVLTLAACQRIMAKQSSSTPHHISTRAKLSDSDVVASAASIASPPSSAPVIASLSDDVSQQEQRTPPQPALPMEEIASVDQPAAPIRMSLKSNIEAEVEPPPFDSVAATQASANGGQLRQKLLRANRFIPASGSLTVPSQTSTTPSQVGEASVLEHDPLVPYQETLQKTARLVSSKEEVIGISRWKTEDLLPLLSSVTPRLASAAFHELQSRLSPQELELAVELAQGTPNQRIQAMERLVHDAHLDPYPWLAWMGSEADREVRFKAVSLLGSINSSDSRLRLRMLHGRERDAEISRHIQSVLLASGSVKPLIR